MWRWRLEKLSFSRIFVLGAGAIGSAYGAALSKKNKVTLIGNREHVEAINSKGLTVSGDMDERFSLEAFAEIDSIPEKALVILTTKAYDSENAISNAKKHLKEDTIILVLQNGLGNEDLVKRIVGKEVQILRAVTTVAAEFLKPGSIELWKGETTIEQGKAARSILETFNQCGLKTRISDNIKEDVWQKLVTNCVVNPLTALFNVANCAIIVDSLKWVRHEIARECSKVAEADGIDLPMDLAQKIDERIAGFTNFSSMAQDISKHRKTEIEFLNGKIVELGRKYKVPTPVSETLVSLIKFLEEENAIS